jgi:CYTH domain-containing protein
MKYARIERERRFLLAELPAGIDLTAGYRQLDDLYLDGTRLRLRSVTAPGGAILEQKLGQKVSAPGGAPTHRLITSLYLEPAEYALLATLPGRRLAKRRYAFPHAGLGFVIDVFLGALAGLLLAEIALDSDAAERALALPPFAHCEVTALPLFTGGALAREDPALVLREARRLLAVVR